MAKSEFLFTSESVTEGIDKSDRLPTRFCAIMPKSSACASKLVTTWPHIAGEITTTRVISRYVREIKSRL
jgi:hypothetical protein